MSDDNVLTSYVAAPDDTGAVGVSRPCNLVGFWVMDGEHADIVTVKLHNSVADKTGPVLMQFDVGEGSASYAIGAFGYTLPGNGVRFDLGHWVEGASGNTITSITLIYK